MMKNKVIKSGPGVVLSHSGKMAPQQGVKPSVAGKTSVSSAGKSGMSAVRAGSGHMFGKQSAAPAKKR